MKKTVIFSVLLVLACLPMMAQQKGGLIGQPKQSKVQHITYQGFINKVWDFEKNPSTFVFKGKTPAIVDFYADWCGPCRKVSPIMEKLAEDFNGRLTVYKVNVDEEKELASVFQVSSIPMVLFVPMKGQPMVQVGAMSEEDYRKVVEEHLLTK